jgi:hypothetical protein
MTVGEVMAWRFDLMSAHSACGLDPHNRALIACHLLNQCVETIRKHAPTLTTVDLENYRSLEAEFCVILPTAVNRLVELTDGDRPASDFALAWRVVQAMGQAIQSIDWLPMPMAAELDREHAHTREQVRQALLNAGLGEIVSGG